MVSFVWHKHMHEQATEPSLDAARVNHGMAWGQDGRMPGGRETYAESSFARYPICLDPTNLNIDIPNRYMLRVHSVCAICHAKFI